MAARRAAELYHCCRRQQFRWLARANFARLKPNFTRAAGENFTSLFRANISPTTSHLSFASQWNHLLNDIQVPDNKKNLCRGEQLRAQSQSALLPRALQPVVQTTPAPFPATSALNDNAPPPLLFCTSSGLSPCSSLCLYRIRIGRQLRNIYTSSQLCHL